MKVIGKLILMVLAVTSLASCGDSASKELAKQLSTSYDKDGQQVQLKGYFALSRAISVINGQIFLELANGAGQFEGSLGDLRVNFGKEANNIYLPDSPQFSDLEIYDNQGNKHDYNTQVTITGTVVYTDKDWEKNAESDDSLKKEAEQRKKETGDPNNYNYYINVEKIEVAK